MTIYELMKKRFNGFENYIIKIYDSDTKIIYKTFKEKSLEKILEQLLKNRFILNDEPEDSVTTIPAPIISGGYQTLQLDLNELLDFYKKFQSKSEDDLIKVLEGVGN